MPAARPLGLATLLLAWGGALLFLLSLLFCAYCFAFRYGDPASGGATLVPAAVDLLLFGVFAGHHSALARSGAKRWLQRFVAPPLERSLYTWVASLLFIAVCAGWQAVPGELYRMTGPLAACGYAAQFAGMAITVRASSAIDVLDLAGVRPVLDARAGREPRHVPLETRGLYAWVRHPLYFAWTLLVFGAPHMSATRFSFAVISTAYLALAIPFEERSLVGLFGTEYRTYQRQVRWRMLPGIY